MPELRPAPRVDITTRLRRWGYIDHPDLRRDLEEAADEIDFLRAKTRTPMWDWMLTATVLSGWSALFAFLAITEGAWMIWFLLAIALITFVVGVVLRRRGV